MIIGSCGAGKSTLARQMHEILQLPVIHLDQHYWRSGWIESEKEDWVKRVQELVTTEEWIMDGNYSGTLAQRIPFADTIILLNYPTYLCLFRILRRYFQYWGKVRPELPAGCPEKLDWDFFMYVKNFRRDTLPKTLQRLAGLRSDQKLLIFDTPKSTNSFLQSIRSGA